MGTGDDGEAGSRVLYDFGDGASATPRPVSIRWAPDGHTLYMKTFDANARAAIWAVPLDAGPPRLLVNFDEPHRPTRRPEFASDGRRFYFTLAQSESDVWVIGLQQK